MKIALASAPHPKSIDEGLCWVEKLVREAEKEGAEIICFPESYIPGYPGMHSGHSERSPEKLQAALNRVCEIAARNSMAVIIPMDWNHADGLLNLAYVISNAGEILGYQTKNQMDPSEDEIWIPGTERSIFEVNGVKFGITICHEGFRYPESVRWAARNEAKIVFHPQCTGSDAVGMKLREWGDRNNPYYEKAMMMRAMENTIYFASTNYSFRYPESASSIISPEGVCIIHETYGRTGIIVADVDPVLATGLLARRFREDLYA